MLESDKKILFQLFENHFKIKAQELVQLELSGSDRRYYRITAGDASCIGTFNENIAENNTYFYFTELFKKHNIPVPQIFLIGKDRRYYVQQDLGNTNLFDLLVQNGFTDEIKSYYQKSLELLAKLQWVAGREVDYKQCFGTSKFDDKAIESDFMYFKYYFVDLHKIVYDKIEIANDINEISKDLGFTQPKTLMYRDFQSRNIMVYKGEIYFIDYQGCMQGNPQYDIASLLWQAKAQIPIKWKDELLNHYVESLNKLPIAKVDEVYLRRGYNQFVLLRLIQVLGAYGFRGLIEKKPHFISSIKHALVNLKQFLNEQPNIPHYPKLRKLLESVASTSIQQLYEEVEIPKGEKLTVTINSFSYKNEIPKDKTENGGGFVFDCRGILNPGRVEKYKKLSGLDLPVQDYLLNNTKMPLFLNHVKGLLDITVSDYIFRGFENLQINFGCTGGQHRSVFASEQIAIYLKKKYGVEIAINHTNKNKWVH